MKNVFDFRYINGIIEFDRKLKLFSSLFPAMVQSKPLSKHFWNIIFVGFLIYFAGMRVYISSIFLLPVISLRQLIAVFFLFSDIIYFVIMITMVFHLYNLGYRFRVLNRFWKHLPSGLKITTPSEWTDSEITVLVESIRLLHAELSEILRLFSLGYGPLLLIFFTLTYMNTTIDMFFIIVIGNYKSKLGYIPYIFYLQYIIYTVSILSITSWVIEEVCIFFRF